MDRVKYKLDLLAKIADLQTKISSEEPTPEVEDTNEEYVHDLQMLMAIDERIEECLGMWYY